MTELYGISLIMVQVMGPVALACPVLMYFFLVRAGQARPPLREVVLIYARYQLARKRHVGVITYLFILSSILFVISVLGLITSSLFWKP